MSYEIGQAVNKAINNTDDNIMSKITRCVCRIYLQHWKPGITKKKKVMMRGEYHHQKKNEKAKM